MRSHVCVSAVVDAVAWCRIINERHFRLFLRQLRKFNSIFSYIFRKWHQRTPGVCVCTRGKWTAAWALINTSMKNESVASHRFSSFLDGIRTQRKFNAAQWLYCRCSASTTYMQRESRVGMIQCMSSVTKMKRIFVCSIKVTFWIFLCVSSVHLNITIGAVSVMSAWMRWRRGSV